MSARYEGVRVYADCPRCDIGCLNCDHTGHIEVPPSEWADALSTIEGVEAIELADRPDGVFRQAVVLPA